MVSEYEYWMIRCAPGYLWSLAPGWTRQRHLAVRYADRRDAHRIARTMRTLHEVDARVVHVKVKVKS